MLDITGVDLLKFARAVYEISWPHSSRPDITDGELQMFIDAFPGLALQMDYVKSVRCKMNVFKEGDKLIIHDQWYDHTEEDLKQLFAICGL